MCTCGFDLCKTSIMVCMRARIAAGQRSTAEVHAHAERTLPDDKGNPSHAERTPELRKSAPVVPVRGTGSGFVATTVLKSQRACSPWIAQAEVARDNRWS